MPVLSQNSHSISRLEVSLQKLQIILIIMIVIQTKNELTGLSIDIAFS